MNRRLGYTILVVVALTVLGVGALVFEFVLTRGRTPAIAGPESVASLEQIRLGGVDQWVLIRGRDRTRPVVLFLHGGPGMPAMFLAHSFQRGWEHDFVVVHWDRSGAGKSFAARRPGSETTVSQTLRDTFELTRELQTRFAQRRIYLVGHSWGSYLGLLAIREHPEFYRAYIGTGQQSGNREEIRALQRAFVSHAARESEDRKLRERASGADFEISEEDLFRFGGELRAATTFLPLLTTGLRAPEYTLRDVLNVKKGADLLGREMQYDVVPGLWDGEIASFDVPVFFFLGRHDFNTPSQLASEYMDRLQSPLKGVVWFEQSAHFPFFEEPDRFHQEMVRLDRVVDAFWAERATP